MKYQPVNTVIFTDFGKPNKGEKMEEDKKMQPWVCGRCGYIYDPQKGDKKGKIPPGVPFEDLPEDWVCPLCGASKKIFNPMLGY